MKVYSKLVNLLVTDSQQTALVYSNHYISKQRLAKLYILRDKSDKMIVKILNSK